MKHLEEMEREEVVGPSQQKKRRIKRGETKIVELSEFE
jgi:hypothetical protein